MDTNGEKQHGLGVGFFWGVLRGGEVAGFTLVCVVPELRRRAVCFPRSGRLGKERIVPHSVVGSPAFFVSLLVFVRAGQNYRATDWWPVLVTALRTVEGYRTPDEAMVC